MAIRTNPLKAHFRVIREGDGLEPAQAVIEIEYFEDGRRPNITADWKDEFIEVPSTVVSAAEHDAMKDAMTFAGTAIINHLMASAASDNDPSTSA